MIGGLIGETDRSEVDQVPFLGEIPVLGNLFKGTSKSDRKTSLFLFVTPTILKRTDETFSDLDRITCERKRKADELIGVIDIPFARFNCGDRCPIDPATGCVRGSGSASDRLDQLGVLEATRFGGVDPSRLQAEAMARRSAMRTTGGTNGTKPCPKPAPAGRLFVDPVAAPPGPAPEPAAAPTTSGAPRR